MIRLTHGDWSVALRPDLGAALARLTWRGRDLLRPAPDGATHPLETASFPLVPYANRIDRGTFIWRGRRIVLPPTAGFEPHALHGLGWRRAWTVSQATETQVDLALEAEAGPDWPWAWSAAHRLRLDDDGLEMTLSITNADPAPMPAGLGLHPYFATTAETVLTAPATGVWLGGADQIPDRSAPASAFIDWSQGAALATAPVVDHAYAGWSGQARLDHPDHAVSITASPNASWLHVYAPGAGGFVCLEPVTHRPDAHNAPADEATGLVALAPGRTLSVSMRIAAADTRPSTGAL